MKKLKAVVLGFALALGVVAVVLFSIAILAAIVWAVVSLGALVGITEDGLGIAFAGFIGFVFLVGIIVGLATAISNVYDYGFKAAWKMVWK